MRRRASFRGMTEINITSLVDVTLTLLIIFMLTAPYIQGGVEVNLPREKTKTVVIKEGPVISVSNQRQVFFAEQLVSIADLGTLLAPWLEQKDTVPVYLRCDQEIPYGFVLKVMTAIEREGFTRLSLVVDQPGGDR